MKLMKMIAVLGVLMLVAAACSTGGETATTPGATGSTGAGQDTTAVPETTISPATTTPSEVPDQEIVFAVVAEPATISPHRVGVAEVNTIGMRNVYESLIDKDPETGDLIPLLATSWEQLDETQWRFYLREGVTFHDGEPFNASAAVTSFEHHFDPDVEGGGGVASTVGNETMRFEAVDDYTLDVFTDEPDPLVPNRMHFFHVFSPLAGGDAPDLELADNAVGTGPYKFVEWVRGQHLTLEANPDWWGHDDPDGNGEVVYTQARYDFRPEGSVRASMLEAGEADFAMWLGPEDCARVDDRDDARCLEVPAGEVIFIRFDAQNEESMMTDLRVREAISLAIDMDLLREEILEGQLVLPAAQIIGPGVTGYVDDLEPYGYDPDRARELLAEYEAEGNEIVPVTWAFQQDRFPRVREFVQAAAAMLGDVGISVEIVEQDGAALIEEFFPFRQPPNRILLHNSGNDLGDFSATLSTYFSQSENRDELGCWCNDPEMWAMIDEAQPLGGEERAAALQEISRHIHEQRYMDYGGNMGLTYGLSDQLDWEPPVNHWFLLKHMAPR